MAHRTTIQLANVAATILGGRQTIGVAVNTDADMTKAVEGRFSVRIGRLIIKPRTLSHRKAGSGKLTVEESDRAARPLMP